MPNEATAVELPDLDETTLPELHDALLDRETLDRLFTDLETQTRILDVRLKQGGAQRADAGGVSLAAARGALESGTVSGVQIRYMWQAAVWCDTLLPASQGVRLIRMKAPEHG